MVFKKKNQDAVVRKRNKRDAEQENLTNIHHPLSSPVFCPYFTLCDFETALKVICFYLIKSSAHLGVRFPAAIMGFSRGLWNDFWRHQKWWGPRTRVEPDPCHYSPPRLSVLIYQTCRWDQRVLRSFSNEIPYFWLYGTHTFELFREITVNMLWWLECLSMFSSDNLIRLPLFKSWERKKKACLTSVSW